MVRERSAFDTVNITAGEAEADSDLDIIGQTNKELDLSQYIDDSTKTVSESSEVEVIGSKKRKRTRERMHDNKAEGEKILWSDGDGDDPASAYQAFKDRKSIKRKKIAAETKKVKATAAKREKKKDGSSMVGRRAASRKLESGDDTTSMKRHNTYSTDSSDEDQLLDQELPDYLKKRKADFEKVQEKLGEAGLKLPPRYDDIDFSEDERIESLEERPRLSHMKPCAPYKNIKLPYSAGMIPAPIAQWLRDYQVEGAAFLHECFVFQRGGILGDDMGLGKTIQVIAFLTAAFGKTGDERDRKRMRKVRRSDPDAWYPRILIICPGTLMANWQNELDRWGWWRPYVYHGSPQSKAEGLAAAQNGRVEIMITTYDTYRNGTSAINMVDWDCVIADECHKIKDRSSEITKAMNEINALCRIGLTGTAIQNNYEELYTLLNWSNPGRFGSMASWKQCISEPLKLGQAHDCTNNQLATARKTAKKLVERLLPQFFIRRMKTLIADQLPKKRDNIVFCPLSETQAEAYERFIDSEVVEMIRTSSDMCNCGSGKKRGWCCDMLLEDGTKWQNHVFPAIVTLQKLCNHLALILPSGNDLQDKQFKDLETLKVIMPDDWKDLYRERDSKLHCANQEFCGKWRILKKLLNFWYTNPSDTGPNKVLVFSHSVRLLRMLCDLFRAKTSYNVSYLDGSIKVDERQMIVDDFNADPDQFVFLISTRAGGVGLNITSANKVVVVDPNWNPSWDQQAQDRAYRIGQTRDVDVFRLVSVGTIEEIVYARQIYKQQQANIGYNASLERRYFRGVQDRKEKKGEIFGLTNLFSYQHDNLVLREIVNKTNVAESRAEVFVTTQNSQGTSSSADDNEDAADGDEQLGDGEKEDAAMSQLAELIKSKDPDFGKLINKKKGRKAKTDAVQAILSGAGVGYTHENSEVVGTSKVESRLSRRAIERGNDIDAIGEHVFSASQSQIDVNISDVGEVGIDSDEVDKVKWRYRPPEEVRRRQFCSMARWCGFEDVTEFALVVEGWTQAQRRNCLERFYKSRRAALFPRKGKPASEHSNEDEEL